MPFDYKERLPLLTDGVMGMAAPVRPWLYEPSRGESAGAAASSQWSHNPTVSTIRHYKIQNAKHGETVGSWELAALDILDQPLYEDSREDEIEPGLTLEEQAKIIKDAGYEGKLEPRKGETAESLRITINERNERDYNEAMLRMSKHGFTDFIAGMGAGFADPFNLAMSFVPAPGINAARMAGWLAKANAAAGVLGRTGVYMAAGAAQGATGMIPLELVVRAGQSEIQADYGMWQSLQNIAMGAVFGAALHPLAGHFGEWRRGRSGLRAQPWEYIPDSAESIELMRANAARIERERLAASPELDAARVAADSKADAVLWDMHMRNLAYNKGIDAREAYASYGYELRNGEMFNQKHARALERVARAEEEIAELEAMRGLAERNPELRLGFSEKALAEAQRELESARAAEARARRGIVAEAARVLGGDKEFSAARAARADRLEARAKRLEDAVALNERRVAAGLESPAERMRLRERLARMEIGAAKLDAAKRAKAEKALAPLRELVAEEPLTRRRFAQMKKALGLMRDSAKSAREFSDALEKAGGRTLGQGLDASQRAGAAMRGVKGSTTFADGVLPMIRLFASHDASTMRHEMAHVMRRNLERAARTGKARPELQRRYAAIEREFDIKGGKWTPEQEEAFAKSFEVWLFQGAAPTPELAEAFEAIRLGMEDVYASADAIGVEISTEARSLFNSFYSVPVAEGKWQFNKALAELQSGRWAEWRAAPDAGASLNQTRPARRALTPEQEARIAAAEDKAAERELADLENEVMARLDDPGGGIPQGERQRALAELEAEIAPAREEYARLEQGREFFEEYIACLI